MKRLLFLLILILVISCKKESDQFIEFNWLVGSWNRVDDAPGSKTFEKWLPTMNGNYTGYGYTLQKNDTVFYEDLAIYPASKFSKSDDKDWVLKVSGVNEEPTIFKIDSISDTSFTAVNLKNKFPTHITYSFTHDTLTATVSNNEHQLLFKFIKRK